MGQGGIKDIQALRDLCNALWSYYWSTQALIQEVALCCKVHNDNATKTLFTNERHVATYLHLGDNDVTGMRRKRVYFFHVRINTKWKLFDE